MLEEARRLADQLSPADNTRLRGLCADIDRLANQLADLEKRGLGNTSDAQAIRLQLRGKLHELVDFMKKVLTDKVVEDFSDITTPLKQFVEAVYAASGQPGRDHNFDDKATNLNEHSSQCANTGLLVARCGPCKNKKTIEGLIDAANKVLKCHLYFYLIEQNIQIQIWS